MLQTVGGNFPFGILSVVVVLPSNRSSLNGVGRASIGDDSCNRIQEVPWSFCESNRDDSEQPEEVYGEEWFGRRCNSWELQHS